ncbi:MAG: VWA domain-containing protein [Hahellaceae bacterium]|nr:VWA domain-containing protein [Hahellaceae bacterium]
MRSFCRLRYFSSHIIVLVSLVFCANLSSAAPKSGNDAPSDIRVLIDISGSMKKNDPNNLRIPAVNLLTELIPEGSTAGVWTFGQYVNMLVKHEKVDAAWRKNAKEKAKQINSVALFTNIGGVLEKSSDDFKGDRRFDNTHFILLTDGMVDVDQNPDVNAQERQRIIEKISKDIKAKGGQIHTVALSKNADTSLLDKLAVETGGNSAIAETPEDLSKVFLRTFDRAVPTEQVPFEGNQFAIDSSVEEFTALIFRQPGSDETVLEGPDEKSYGFDQQGEYLKWYRDEGYDLITVLHPLEGTWTVKAKMAPESRVTVVSNLRMNVSRLPANFYAGDQLDVEVSFDEDGKTVTNHDFLSLMDVLLRLTTEDKKSGTKRLSNSDNVPADGVFRDSISKLNREGQYEVDVLVDGKTFQRKHHQVITLRSPLDIELSASGYDESTKYDLIITPRSDKIDLQATSIVTKLKAPDGSNIIKTVPLNAEKQRWEMPVEAVKGDGTYEVALKVKGVNLDGNEFKFAPRTFEAVFPRSVADSNQYISLSETPKEALPEIAPEALDDSATQPETPIAPIEIPQTLEQESVEPVSPEETESQLILWVAIGGGVFLTLALCGGLAWWMLKKRKLKEENEDDFDSLSDDELTVGVFDDLPEDTVMDDVPDALDFVEEVPAQSVPEPAVSADTLAELDSFGEMSETEDVAEESIPVLEEEVPTMSYETEIEADIAEEIEDLDVPEATEINVDDLLGEMNQSDSEDFGAETETLEAETPGFESEVLDEVVDGKTAEDVADQILADNAESEDDEEFNLEDFDIADTDDLDGLSDKKI